MRADVGAVVRETPGDRAQSAWAPIVAYGSATVWFFGVLGLALIRHASYQTGRFDHGNMVQAIWNTAHGHFLELTFQDGEQTIRLAAHADIFLALLVPLWVVFPSPVMLIVVQTAALALGAVPVFWLARRHIRSDAGAAAMVIAYLLYPWLIWAALGDFHAVTVGICFLLFAIWALDSDRLGLFSVFAFLALTTQELVGLTVAGLGVWYALARGRRAGGAVIAAIGLGWSLICIGIVIPAFAGGSNVFYGRFDSVGGSPTGVLRELIHDPASVLGAMSTGDDYVYLVLLLAPLAFMWLYSPWIALAASPIVAINLLSDWYASTSPKFHYTAAIIPFLIASTVFGADRFSPGRARGAVLVAVVSGLFFVALAPKPDRFVAMYNAAPRSALLHATNLVPDNARVAATENVAGRLSERRVVYSFPKIRDAEWIVVDRADTWLPDTPSVRQGFRPNEFREALKRLHADPRFQLVFEQDGVEVLRRTARTPPS